MSDEANQGIQPRTPPEQTGLPLGMPEWAYKAGVKIAQDAGLERQAPPGWGPDLPSQAVRFACMIERERQQQEQEELHASLMEGESRYIVEYRLTPAEGLSWWRCSPHLDTQAAAQAHLDQLLSDKLRSFTPETLRWRAITLNEALCNDILDECLVGRNAVTRELRSRTALESLCSRVLLKDLQEVLALVTKEGS